MNQLLSQFCDRVRGTTRRLTRHRPLFISLIVVLLYLALWLVETAYQQWSTRQQRATMEARDAAPRVAAERPSYAASARQALAATPASDVARRVRLLIAEMFDKNVSDLSPGSDLVKDLGADSLELIQLRMNMEDEFKLEISDEDAERLCSVGATEDYIQRQVAAAAAKTAVGKKSVAASKRR